MGKLILLLMNFSLLNKVRIDTICLFIFGTSIPMVPRPGIGAIIRMPKAAKFSAMSSSKFLIFEIRTPSAGTISYKVTVGPTVALMRCISMPKLLSVWII